MSTQLKGKNTKEIQNNNITDRVIASRTKTRTLLEPGINATTMHPGYKYPIMFKEVLAGETIDSWEVDAITRILTPLVPTMGKQYITIEAHFVPHTRVWDNAEAALAGQDRDPKINYEIPWAETGQTAANLQIFKNTLAARYGIRPNANDANGVKFNLLLLRGYRAISNDMWRNKQYEEPLAEWNNSGSATSKEELAVNGYTLNPTLDEYVLEPNAYVMAPAPARKGYFTEITNKLYKGITDMPDAYGKDGHSTGGTEAPANESVNVHLDWQTKYMNAKQDAMNENMNDWDIIAALGGTAPITANQVIKLGEIDYELNYQQITQSAPNIDEAGSPLGTTGSFSYTRATGTLFNYKHFQQAGFIHITASVGIDPGYEDGIPKELLKLNIDELYRPGLDKIETQLIKRGEISGYASGTHEGVAFQKPWAEYTRMPQLVTGQMLSDLGQIEGSMEKVSSVSHWHNKPSLNTQALTIDENYFRPAMNTNRVLQRNNIIQQTEVDWGTVTDMMQKNFTESIMQMSEHRIKTALPISHETVKGEETARKQR